MRAFDDHWSDPSRFGPGARAGRGGLFMAILSTTRFHGLLLSRAVAAGAGPVPTTWSARRWWTVGRAEGFRVKQTVGDEILHCTGDAELVISYNILARDDLIQCWASGIAL